MVNGSTKLLLERLNAMERRMDERHQETRESIKEEIVEVKAALNKNDHEHELLFAKANENSRGIVAIQTAQKWMWGTLGILGTLGIWISDKFFEILSYLKK